MKCLMSYHLNYKPGLKRYEINHLLKFQKNILQNTSILSLPITCLNTNTILLLKLAHKKKKLFKAK